MSDAGELYYIRDRDQDRGPFDYEALRKRVASRQLARHHRVSPDKLTWHRAGETFPELFGLRPAAGNGGPGGAGSEDAPALVGAEIVGEPTWPPPGDRHVRQRPSGMVVAAYAGAIGGLVCVALVVTLMWVYPWPWTADDVKRIRAPRVVAVSCTNPGQDKWSCFGIVVSKSFVIVPVRAATFTISKVATYEADDVKKWNSARLVHADPVAGLAVLRAELEEVEGEAMPLRKDVDWESNRETSDDFYLVAAGLPEGDSASKYVIRYGRADDVLNEGEPEERVLVKPSHQWKPTVENEYGRAIIDPRGDVVGQIVGEAPNGMFLCATADEIEAIWKTAKKIPADKTLEPIELPPAGPASAGAGPELPPKKKGTGQHPDPPHAGESTPPPGPADAQPSANPTQDQSDVDQKEPSPDADASATKDLAEPPAENKRSKDKPQAESAPQRRQRKGPGAQGVVGAIGDLGNDVVTGISDAIVPELPPDMVKKLGDNQRAKLLAKHPACKNRATVARIKKLCDQMLVAAKVEPRDYTLTVVEDEEINAFSFINGNLAMTTGFIEFAGRDDDMICFVLAHEIGHLVLRHTDLPYQRAVAAGHLVPGGDGVVDVAERVVGNSPMNQAQERDADSFAVRVLRDARRSHEGAIRFFKRFDESAQEKPGSAATGLGALFSSHPDSRERIEAIENEAAAAE